MFTDSRITRTCKSFLELQKLLKPLKVSNSSRTLSRDPYFGWTWCTLFVVYTGTRRFVYGSTDLTWGRRLTFHTHQNAGHQDLESGTFVRPIGYIFARTTVPVLSQSPEAGLEDRCAHLLFSPLTANVYLVAIPTLSSVFHNTIEHITSRGTIYMIVQATSESLIRSLPIQISGHQFRS